ncbi:hypothetical protein FA13DRAFT_1722941, partial [Coprinellus micaceus]
MWNSGVEHGQMGVMEQQAHVPYLGLVAGAWSSGTGYGSAEHGMGNGTTLHRALGMEEFNGFVKGVPWVTEVTGRHFKLQDMQVKEFSKYGLSTLGINEDTPNDKELWE